MKKFLLSILLLALAVSDASAAAKDIFLNQKNVTDNAWPPKILTPTANSVLVFDATLEPTIVGTTGTGTIVRSVSPTFTTPNIGAATGTSIALTGGAHSLGGNAGGAATLRLNGAAGQLKYLVTQSGGLDRWYMGQTTSTESTGNAGSNFNIVALADDGTTVIDQPLTIVRAATGNVTTTRNFTVSQNLTVGGTGTHTFAGAVSVSGGNLAHLIERNKYTFDNGGATINAGNSVLTLQRAGGTADAVLVLTNSTGAATTRIVGTGTDSGSIANGNGGTTYQSWSPSGTTFTGNLTVAVNNSRVILNHNAGANQFSLIESNAGTSSSYNGAALTANWKADLTQGNTTLPSWRLDLGGVDGPTTGTDQFSIMRSPATSTTFTKLLTVGSTGNLTLTGTGTHTMPGALSMTTSQGAGGGAGLPGFVSIGSSGSLTLPTATGSGLFFDLSASPIKRMFIGDGSGYSLVMASRTGSANTDRFTFTDSGELRILNTTNYVVRNAANSGAAARITADASDNAVIDAPANTELRLQVGSGTKLSLNSSGNGTLSGNLTVSGTQASTSTTTGSGIFGGGIGAAGNLTIGGNATVTGGVITGGSSITLQTTVGDANTIGGWRFWNGNATTAGRYISIAVGKDATSGGSAEFGVKTDTATPANARAYIVNYGDNQDTQSLVIAKGGNVTIGQNATVGANLTANGTSHTYGTNAGSSITSKLNGAAGQLKYHVFQSAGTDRWYLGSNSDAEGTGNAGSNFRIVALTDAGAVIDTPITITRAAAGTVAIARPTSIGSGGATIKAIRSVTASLDFASMASGSAAVVTATVTGAAVGDTVTFNSNDGGAYPDEIDVRAWVSAADTVSLRAINRSAGTYDPAAKTYRITVASF